VRISTPCSGEPDIASDRQLEAVKRYYLNGRATRDESSAEGGRGGECKQRGDATTRLWGDVVIGNG
jgi:hypothetical protein